MFIKNIWPIIEYFQVKPWTNVVIEGLLSITNELWADKKIVFLTLQSKYLRGLKMTISILICC